MKLQSSWRGRQNMKKEKKNRNGKKLFILIDVPVNALE